MRLALESALSAGISPEQVKTNVAALEWEIGSEMMAEIGEVLEPFENM
jgi:aryl-alcohol dehydrogenase-like predicted oxidoreductase